MRILGADNLVWVKGGAVDCCICSRFSRSSLERVALRRGGIAGQEESADSCLGVYL